MAAPVDHQRAALSRLRGADQGLAHGLAGLRPVEPVKVDPDLHANVAGSQSAQVLAIDSGRASLHALARACHLESDGLLRRSVWSRGRRAGRRLPLVAAGEGFYPLHCLGEGVAIAVVAAVPLAAHARSLPADAAAPASSASALRVTAPWGSSRREPGASQRWASNPSRRVRPLGGSQRKRCRRSRRWREEVLDGTGVLGARDREADPLPQVAHQPGRRILAPLEVAARQLPETAEQTGRRAAHGQDLAAPQDPSGGGLDAAGRRLPLLDRERRGIASPVGVAVSRRAGTRDNAAPRGCTPGRPAPSGPG